MATRRYQRGSICIRERKNGPAVYQFRWVENGKMKSELLGTVEKLNTERELERAVERIRVRINDQQPAQDSKPVQPTVGQLIDRFMEEVAKRQYRRNTRECFEGLFRNHVRPRWGNELVQNVKAIDVQNWLKPYPYSRQVRMHIKKLMSIVFRYAVEWRLIGANPMRDVRLNPGDGKPLKKQRALTAGEVLALSDQLAEPYRTMVLVAACTGLRVSELVALEWGDISFENLTLKVQRCFVRGEMNPPKTDASEAELPIDPYVGELLLSHKAKSHYKSDSDFVFASDAGKPRWPCAILQDYIKPAAERAGIGRIGWHVLRHTFSSLLANNGATLVAHRDMLRHADSRTSLDVYSHTTLEQKREAASKVVGALCSK